MKLVGFVEEREKWAEKIRGESWGEPNKPIPDFKEKEKGAVLVLVVESGV